MTRLSIIRMDSFSTFRIDFLKFSENFFYSFRCHTFFKYCTIF